MGKEKKINLLEEKSELTRGEVVAKIKRLDGYIKKAETRVRTHEKALARLREEMRKEVQRTVGSILRGKVYG